ncbi:hypothetical protein J8TS2_11100 [Lederbergia ruris]|uniref:Uncharacterized protein n=1 Tax=Lederbergia ruris TaxID=217495 RepID=A0ABQ4KH69_9BACI|nr:hypothetical protein J8TS2_11100 [Lederbergia ruris]
MSSFPFLKFISFKIFCSFAIMETIHNNEQECFIGKGALRWRIN